MHHSVHFTYKMSLLKFFVWIVLASMPLIALSDGPCKLASASLGLRQWNHILQQLPNNKPFLQEIVSTSINISLAVNSMKILNFEAMDMEYNLIMTQRWYDYRLAPGDETKKLAIMGAIWQPKVTFTVGTVYVHNNDLTQYWRGTSNNSVLYSERLLVKSTCTDNMKKYPFDTQQCILKLGSYRFTSEEVNLVWDIVPIELSSEINLIEFQLLNVNTYNEINIRRNGNFSILVAEFLIARNSLYVITTTIVPSSMFILVSYAVFWLKTLAIQSRIFLCIFSFTGLLYLYTTANCNVTGSSQFKALDIWFVICFICVLLSFIESIIISLEIIDDTNTEAIIFEYKMAKRDSKKYITRMDKLLRFLYPIGFLSCTILFFVIFAHT